MILRKKSIVLVRMEITVLEILGMPLECQFTILSKKYKGINLYAQPERNDRNGVVPDKIQLEFAQRYIYSGCYRAETWEEYCKRKGKIWN